MGGLQRYQFMKPLGQSPTSKTWLAIAATPPTSPPCVIQQWQAADQPAPFLASGQWQSPWQTVVDRLRAVGEHPQVPALLDHLTADDRNYLVHAYIPGDSLATVLLQQGKFSTTAIWHVLEQLLPVLQWVHDHGLIHRDIQPANIIQRSPNPTIGNIEISTLILVDFGNATLVTDTPLLQGGMMVGSPEYTAPEQLQGQAVCASDLYALGVTCIHLLTGISPFQLFDSTTHRWVWRNYWVADSPSPDQDDHTRLAQMLDQMIAPDQGQRFPSAKVAIATLQRLRGTKIMTPVPTTPRPTWDCYATLTGHQGLFSSVNAIAIAPHNPFLASASDDKTARVWDVMTQQELAKLQHSHFVKAVAFHPQDDTILASGGSDRTIRLWDWRTGNEHQHLAGHTHLIQTLQFRADGAILASGSADKTMKLWNPTTGELLTTLKGHTLAVNAIAFMPAARDTSQTILASASTDTTVRIWDLDTGKSIQTLKGHTWAVKALAFHPNGTLLATGSEDRTVRLWETTTWTCVTTLSGHPWAVAALAFSTDGTLLFSGSWDKTLKCWQVSDGQEMTTLVGHTDSVTCLAIATSGELIASGSKDATIKLWHPTGN